MDEDRFIPPRNGEVAARSADGGVDSHVFGPTTAFGGPPPRSGEERRRVKHRTLAASDQNIRLARKLRRSMTLPEILLWNALRTRPSGLRFRKQHPVRGYVADFACLSHRLIIEVGGEAHNRGDRPRRDAARDASLREEGFDVLRIAAREVLDNLEGVVAGIVARCSEVGPLHRPAAGPPPRAGEDL